MIDSMFAFILNAPAAQRAALDSLWAEQADFPDGSLEWDTLYGQIEDLEGPWVAARQRAETLEAMLQCLVTLDVSAWKAEQYHYSVSTDFGGTILSALKEQFGIDLDDEANLDWLSADPPLAPLEEGLATCTLPCRV
jgi:hypothetical protein